MPDNAPRPHASTQRPHPAQRPKRSECSGRSSQLSGLWHHRHLRGHPFRKTVVRIPGPSWMANRLTSKITPVFDLPAMFTRCLVPPRSHPTTWRGSTRTLPEIIVRTGHQGKSSWADWPPSSARYAREWILDTQDVSAFVAARHHGVESARIFNPQRSSHADGLSKFDDKPQSLLTTDALTPLLHSFCSAFSLGSFCMRTSRTASWAFL